MSEIMDGCALIKEERARQINVLKWSKSHDSDSHQEGQLVDAAICYAAPYATYYKPIAEEQVFYSPWPWGHESTGPNIKKPYNQLSLADRIGRLAKAGALIAAEIDRLQQVVLDGKAD